jgi:hypothetical protein
MQAFPSITHTNIIFIKGVKKTRRDYKNRKTSVIRNVGTFVEDYIRGRKDEPVQSMTSFKDLRQAINRDFEYHWLRKIFHFGVETIDFDNILALGLSFLRCKPLLKASLALM